MDDQNKNLILATALSFVVILIWFVLFPPPEPQPAPQTTEISQSAETGITAATPQAAQGNTAAAGTAAATGATDTSANTPRVQIETPRLSGSISLTGGRIDQLALKDYRETVDPESAIVEMLSPAGSASAYYALYGWAPGAGLTLDDVPGANTAWQVESGDVLAPVSPSPWPGTMARV